MSARGRLKPGAATVLREIASMLATLVVASIIVFGLVQLFPGDPAEFLAGRTERRPSQEAIEAIRHELGLDRSLPMQYLTWLGSTVRGDLGSSWLSGKDVVPLIGDRLGATVLLGSVTLAIGLALTIVFGARAAIAPGGPVDFVLRLLAVTSTAVPSFVLGLLLIRFVAVQFGIGSVIGDGTLRTVFLPAMAGAAGLFAYWVRPFRALVRDALDSDWAITSRARGVSGFRLLAVHAIPNALVGFLPFLGLGVAGVIAGSILVENVFAWPGVGPMVLDAIRRRDLPVIQGFTLVSTAAYVITTRGTDIVAALADPRRRRPVGMTPSE